MGDTVKITKLKYLIQYKEKRVHDTLYISKTDTVKEVGVKDSSSKGSPFWPRAIMALISFSLAFVIICLIFRFGK